jgi:hypothetical protein
MRFPNVSGRSFLPAVPWRSRNQRSENKNGKSALRRQRQNVKENQHQEQHR